MKVLNTQGYYENTIIELTKKVNRLNVQIDNNTKFESAKKLDQRIYSESELFFIVKKALNTDGVFNDKYTKIWIEQNL